MTAEEKKKHGELLDKIGRLQTKIRKTNDLDKQDKLWEKLKGLLAEINKLNGVIE